jgi:hypothetical protein
MTILTYADFLKEKANPCWKGYKQIGTKKKNGRIVPNCVRESEDVDNTEGFDRTDYYLDYYRNLSPTGFGVDRFGDSIVIRVPDSAASNPML